jgi:hypothetical protein
LDTAQLTASGQKLSLLKGAVSITLDTASIVVMGLILSVNIGEEEAASDGMFLGLFKGMDKKMEEL